MSEISKAIVKAQKLFGKALKTSNNPHFRSKYADLSNVIEAVIDGLHESNIALIQKTHDVQGGVKVETIFLHETGEEYSAGLLFIPAVKQDAQGYGSALTYARRYSLMSACGVAPEDDDGNADSQAPRQQPPQQQPQHRPAPTMTMEQAQAILEMASTMQELVAAWNQVPAEFKKPLMSVKDAIKGALTNGA
jgi:hypothetical protein